MADLVLGIDAGGTFTDALLYCKKQGSILAQAKTPTTHDDLSLCLAAALESVLGKAIVEPSEISVVSVSTTLATNALVEDTGRAAGLITIGFKEDALSRAGLSRITGSSPHLKLAGGHSSYGHALQDLDLEPLQEWLTENDLSLEAYAVAGSFSVRNPEHEHAVSSFIKRQTGKPVTVSHELSSLLNAPKRATTALLNARLLPIIKELISAVENSMLHAGLKSRLMVMRGDGSLVSSNFVKDRPIETILSGPAASAIGAAALAGIEGGIVTDIGGTTTDVAVISEGRPIAAPSGAVVGGHETMVSAVRAHTFGIGGDSHVKYTPRSQDPLTVGPSRAIPLVTAAVERPLILTALSKQLTRGLAQETDGVFVWLRDITAAGQATSRAENEILAKLERFPEGTTLERLASTQRAHNIINRLISSSVIGVSAFTPTDAAHILGMDARYPSDVAVVGGNLLARQLDRFGVPLARSEWDLANLVLECVQERVAEAILVAAAERNALSAAEVSFLLNAQRSRAITADQPPLLNIGLGVAAPVVLVGAPVRSLGPPKSEERKIHFTVPEHFEIANAYGAAIGDIRLADQTTVSAPRRGLFRVHVDEPINFYDLKAAQRFAEETAETRLGDQMRLAGGQSCDITHKWDLNQATVEDRELFVEATLYSTALGFP